MSHIIFTIQWSIIALLLIISLYVGIKDLNKMKKINTVLRENRKKLFINPVVCNLNYN